MFKAVVKSKKQKMDIGNKLTPEWFSENVSVFIITRDFAGSYPTWRHRWTHP